MNITKETLIELINEADSICIGAGAGLSSAAGFEYGGKNFLDNFKYMHDLYGYNDMYSAGFHDFDSLESMWGYWSKFIYLNRYKEGAKPLYKRLLELVKDKNYFVITSNVDHQFNLAGFKKERIYYMQGDYGLIQCSVPCHNKTYDNKDIIMKMISNINEDHKIPSSLIPYCPICGKPMTTNLRCDDSFVQDEGWYKAKANFDHFIKENRNKKILYLELGVGYSTPVWIKYPFLQNTYRNANAKYVCIDKGYIMIPNEIKKQSYTYNGDINDII